MIDNDWLEYLKPEFKKEYYAKLFEFVKKAYSETVVYPPSEDIFNALFEKYDLKAEECVFFDDKEKNVNGAKKTGMHGFVFEGYEKACKDLEGLVESLNN